MGIVKVYKFYNSETGKSFIGLVKDAREAFGLSRHFFDKKVREGVITRAFLRTEIVSNPQEPQYVFFNAEGEWVFTGSKIGCARELGLDNIGALAYRIRKGDYIVKKYNPDDIDRAYQLSKTKKVQKREHSNKEYLFKAIYRCGI